MSCLGQPGPAQRICQRGNFPGVYVPSRKDSGGDGEAGLQVTPGFHQKKIAALLRTGGPERTAPRPRGRLWPLTPPPLIRGRQ